MLYLVTGLPGSGKTLRAIKLVQELGASRPVYVRGVKGCRVPGWETLEDGTSWPELPEGSVVLLDEAQEVFRVRPSAAAVPDHVAALETHRHGGFDLVIVTQHPHLIDTHVRKLIGRHLHLSRNFGRSVSTCYQWERCVAEPTNAAQQKEAIRSTFKHPRELFDKYDSAVMHTHRRDFPLVLLARVGVLGLVVVGAVAYAWMQVREDVPAEIVPGVEGGERSGPVRLGAVSGGDAWTAGRVARVPAVYESAPYYDPLYSKPRSAPAVAGCLLLEFGDGSVRCECHTSQGTDVDLELAACIVRARAGSFDPLREVEEPNADVIRRLERESAFALSFARSAGGAADVGSGAPAGGSVP